MSKAKIVEHLGRGQYRVKLLIDVEAIKERIKVLDDQIAQSTALINGKLKDDIASAKSALNAIDVTQTDSDTQQKLADAHHQLDKANQALAREKADRESKITELGKLKAVDEETIKDLWCADYNLDLEKDLTVGVIDLYQLRDTTTSNRQIIVPGYIDSKPECAYNPIRDGRLTPAFTLTPNSWWYAMMTCAGLERFNPRYRKGEITFIYNLTGSELEAEINKATVQVNASKDEVKRLDDLIHEKNATMNDLTDALETLQTELAELQQANAEPELITAKQQQINDKQIEITDLENETNSLKYDLQLAQEQLDADQSHLNALNAGHNLCNVTVDDNYTQLRPSEMHSLVNKELYLRNVPARYLSCDELAFKVGDRVVLEYPLKNIHTRLMAIYHAKLTDLTRVKAERQSKIDAKQAEIDAKQAEIDALQTQADELTATIKTENDDNGITDLQAQIDALEDDITAINQDINTYQDDKDSAQSDVNNLSNQIADKQAQLISLQQQLDDLINSGANQADIDAKEAEITNCLSDIASLQNDLQQATQALSEADVNLNNSLAAKKAKMQEKNDKLNIITPLLNVNTLSKQELKFTLEDIVFKNNQLRGLEDDRLVLEISITGIDAQVLKLQQLEAQETARSDKLKAFADTRPKEITIVGFESNPRPCSQVFCTYTDSAIISDDVQENKAPYNYGRIARFIYQSNKAEIINKTVTFKPIIANNFYAGERYWINTDQTECVSWYKDCIYINGNYIKILNNPAPTPPLLKNELVACCLPEKDTLAFIEHNPNTHQFYIGLYNTKNKALIRRQEFATYSTINDCLFEPTKNTLIVLEIPNSQSIFKVTRYTFSKEFNSFVTNTIHSTLGNKVLKTYRGNIVTDDPFVGSGGGYSTFSNQGMFMPEKMYASCEGITLVGNIEFYNNVVYSSAWSESLATSEQKEQESYKKGFAKVKTHSLEFNSIVTNSSSGQTISKLKNFEVNQGSFENITYSHYSDIIYANADKNLCVTIESQINGNTTISYTDTDGSKTGITEFNFSIIIYNNKNRIIIENHTAVFNVDTPANSDDFQVDGIGTDNDEEYYRLDALRYEYIKTTFAFDGILFIMVYTISNNFDIAHFDKTLIFNIKNNKYQILDYRIDQSSNVDNNNDPEYFPLSVTTLKKSTA